MEEAAKLFDMKVLHVGINATGEEQALGWAEEFLKFFDLPTKNGNSSVFAGTAVEAMKSKGLGSKGHIAVATNSVVRAKNYLEMMGYKFNEESAKFKGDKMTAIYLADEIGGFAVHLVQK